MPRDGTKNLKPMNQRTKEEQKKIATKAGKASGVARRKKADLKKAMELLLSLDIQDKKLKQTLEDMGMDGSNQSLLAFATFQQAVKGNQKATENILKLTNTKDSYDIQEQRERIKSLKLDNKEREEVNKIDSESITLVDSWEADDANS
ncbi:TPA: stress-induced protein [Streptococcus agalactiae]|uniref:stress-induced protein n=1 Tax=Streptococcus agalactiae TaxID=1311 RepID=UPI000D6F22DB|nr:stress-induced protein [Streptococcus agalactiae]PWT25399.1 stress-induced protein [Streptococcus agalactiae]HEN3143865.1 stress-induced protein [Streptococcus agalactiae]